VRECSFGNRNHVNQVNWISTWNRETNVNNFIPEPKWIQLGMGKCNPSIRRNEKLDEIPFTFFQ